MLFCGGIYQLSTLSPWKGRKDWTFCEGGMKDDLSVYMPKRVRWKQMSSPNLFQKCWLHGSVRFG
jgi:hypothetical protein